MSLSKWEVRNLCEHSWIIPNTQLHEGFSKYYLLYWRADYFRSQMIEGRLHHQDTSYLVYFHGSVYPTYPGTQIALSFRLPLPKYNLPGVVLVASSTRNYQEQQRHLGKSK